MPGQIGLGRRSRVRFGLHGAIAGMMMGEDKRRARSDGSLGPVDHVSLPLLPGQSVLQCGPDICSPSIVQVLEPRQLHFCADLAQILARPIVRHAVG
jgi:hypothetical protein